VPSIAEQGYPDFEASLWWYVAAPAGTRLELVRKLSDKIVQGLKSEAVRERMPDAAPQVIHRDEFVLAEPPAGGQAAAEVV